MYNLWVDDIRSSPYGYVPLKSVNETIRFIKSHIDEIDVISFDHDAGDYAWDGGDYINILNWLEEQGLSYRIHLHTMNPVGHDNMMRIIQHNKWQVL